MSPPAERSAPKPEAKTAATPNAAKIVAKVAAADRRQAIASSVAKSKASPAASDLTSHGTPRERSVMRCSKCGELGKRSDGCGRTHNVVPTIDDTSSDDSEEEEPAAMSTDVAIDIVADERPVLVIADGQSWRNATRNPAMPRSKTISVKNLTRSALAIGAAEVADFTASNDYAAALAARPRTRGDCTGHVGPCPWVSCRHHLYLDADPDTGAIKLNFPDLEPWELTETCALDAADRGPAILDEISQRMNVVRERARQMETSALFALRRAAKRQGFGVDVLSGFAHVEGFTEEDAA